MGSPTKNWSKLLTHRSFAVGTLCNTMFDNELLLSARSLAGQLVGGGVRGAIVTVIVGMIMNAMNKR